MALPRMFLPKATLIPFTKTPRWASLDFSMNIYGVVR